MVHVYKASVVMKFRDDRFMFVEEKVVFEEGLGYGGVKLLEVCPLSSRKNDGIRLFMTVEASNREEAEQKLFEFTERLALALCCRNNIGVRVEIEDIIPAIESVKIDDRVYVVMITDTISIKDENEIGLKLSKDLFKEAVEVIQGLPEEVLRFLFWYSRALLEKDPVNCFIMLWTALEVWKTYLYPADGHRKGMKKVFDSYGCKGFKNIYELRNKVFHAGARMDVEKFLQEVMNCVYQIVKQLRGQYYNK